MLLRNCSITKYLVSKRKVFVKKILIKDLKKVSKNPRNTLFLKKALKSDLWELYKPV